MKRESVHRASRRVLLLVGLGLLAPLAVSAQFPGLDKIKKLAESQRPWTAYEEKAIGEATAAKMIAVFGLYEEPKAVRYVNLVGRTVAQFSPRQDLAYHFGILDTDTINAFATPGGYIFVNRGLLANLENEAELAGVLAHELIHTGERHLEKELQNRKLAGIAVEEGAQQIPVSELAELANHAVNLLLAGKFSRDKEREADSKGLELVAAAGYDPSAYPEFLAWLGEASKQRENRRALGILVASHPKFSDRIKRLKKLIKKRKWDKEDRPRLPERYVANVVFGAAPAEATAVPAAVTTTEAAPAPAESKPAAGAQASQVAGSSPGTASESGFGLRPFSADQIMTQGSQRHQAKLYVREKAFRMETEQGGEKAIVIMRFDHNVMWSLLPEKKMYAEMPLRPERSFFQAARQPDAQVERELLGSEPVGPYRCRKYRLRVTYEGDVHTGIQWAAEELDGFVVKMLDERTNAVLEYQNISLEPPDLSLFEIPPGYQKLSFGGVR